MTEFKSRNFVAAKGCLDRLLNPTQVCVNLGEAKNTDTSKKAFYCNRNFPKDCSEYGCPKMMSISQEWLKDLKNLDNYE